MKLQQDMYTINLWLYFADLMYRKSVEKSKNSDQSDSYGFEQTFGFDLLNLLKALYFGL